MPKSTPERRIDRKFTAPVTAAASAATTGSLAVHALVSDYHTATGLTAGHVFQATDTDSFGFAALDHADLANVTANQHHNQSHVLATIAGLGPDHTVSGLTVGQVLQAKSGTTAAFDNLSHAHLTNVTANQHHNQVHNILGSDHTYSGGAALDVFGLSAASTLAKITPSSNPGALAAILRTDSAGTLALDTDTLYVHAGFDNVWINSGTPDGSAALRVTSANSADISLHVRQISGQTARILRIDDNTGQELIVLDSVGNLQSGNPGFVSGLTGWQITPIGNAEFNNGVFRGELHASIFVVDEFHASGGTLVVAPGGKLENDFTVNYTTGSQAVLDIRTTSGSGSGSQLDIRSTGSGSGTQLTTRTIANRIDISDPESGHAQLFGMGDTLRIKAIGSMSPGIDIWDVWMKVSRVEDLTDYWRYHVEIVSGGTHGLIIPAGTAVISYGVEGDGRILLTADQSYAPYQDIFTIGAEPWNGDITPHIRLGRLDGVGLPGVSGIEQYGLVAGEDLSNADSAYLILSNLQQAMYRIQSTWHDAANPTVSISPDGRVKIGLDIGNDATTAFDFDPASGTLTIGNASYPAAVTLYGSMTITSGTGYGNLVDIPTSLSDINGSEGSKLGGIAAGATVGAVWGVNIGSQPSSLGDINGTEGTKLAGIAAGATVGADWSSNVSNRPIDSIGKLVAAPAPSGAGLYLGSTYMGYYSGSAWTMYMDNTGKQGWGGTSGARLAWDGTDLYGTNGTTVQWYARASTGKLYAGAGDVTLDANGIKIKATTSYAFKNALSFTDSLGNEEARLFVANSSGQTNLNLEALPSNAQTANRNAVLNINAIPAGIGTALISIDATSAGTVSVTGDFQIDGNHVIGIRTTA